MTAIDEAVEDLLSQVQHKPYHEDMLLAAAQLVDLNPELVYRKFSERYKTTPERYTPPAASWLPHEVLKAKGIAFWRERGLQGDPLDHFLFGRYFSFKQVGYMGIVYNCRNTFWVLDAATGQVKSRKCRSKVKGTKLLQRLKLLEPDKKLII